MSNLASTYWNQGRWTEAEKLFAQVMETWKTVLGPEHPDTLTSMDNLASTYQNQGRWTEAEKLAIVCFQFEQPPGPMEEFVVQSSVSLFDLSQNMLVRGHELHIFLGDCLPIQASPPAI
jgi:hypothetical protein